MFASADFFLMYLILDFKFEPFIAISLRSVFGCTGKLDARVINKYCEMQDIFVAECDII